MVMLTAPDPAQVETAVPAFADGFGPKVKVLVATSVPEQGETAVPVKVKVTLPDEMSAALGA